MKAKLIKKGKNHYDLRLDDGGLYTSTYQWTSNGNLLSLKNCQTIERGYDLDKLYLKHYLEEGTPNVYVSKWSFMEGARVVLEILGDKKFSEEDLREAISQTRKGMLYNKKYEDEYIKSIQQTEWDCIVEMEDFTVVHLGGDNEIISQPKRDSDGCLILKRKP